jgi:16S rRNA (cytosine1402-N4)-methyltransferase
MVREVVEALRPEDGGWFVDCTLGLGGHGRALLEAGAGACLLGLDRDADALGLASARLAGAEGRFKALHANFKDVDRWAPLLPEAPAGILVDLGMSGFQLKSGRGFSFHDASALDMRMDPSGGESARNLLNGLPEKDLARLLRSYGEEPFAGRIARAICRERLSAPLEDAATLARIVSEAVPAAARGKLHPATRTFQALRIAVNRELDGLEGFVERAADLLRCGGRLAILAYHSLEDRAVKDTLRRLAKGCVCPPRLPTCACGRLPAIDLPHRKALRPSAEEVSANPASRSARLRVAVKR